VSRATDEDEITLTITEAEAGERLDRVLAARDLGYSRSAIARFIADERVELDGEVVPSKTKVTAGAEVILRPAPPPPSEAIPQDIPLDVVFEDAHLLVVNKPAGLVVHPAAGHPDGTLVNAILHHLEGERPPGRDPERPGIVHRLDKDTSGVMVIAKSTVARDALVERFSKHEIERAYLAIAVGHPPESVSWDTLHGRHPKDRKRFSSKVDKGKRAVTHLRVLERLHGASLVECRLETGRTHQIRVHLADAGHPILGDPLYGGRPRDPRLRAAGNTLGRQALHARLLGLAHPVTGESQRFEVEAPESFRAALEALRD
jgi:23S rRNA pseudouridine1911/1915/1917 synthase